MAIKKKKKKSRITGGTGVSKGVTIAPGKRYYGPKELRPSTKYKRGGELAKFKERGGKIPEMERKGFVDIGRAKFQMQKAGGMPPPEGPAAKVTRGGMSPGFARKFQEARTQMAEGEIPTGEEPYTVTPGIKPGETAWERMKRELSPTAPTGDMEARMQSISEATGLPADWITPAGVIAAGPIIQTMAAGTGWMQFAPKAGVKYAAGKGLTHVSFFGGPKVLTHTLTPKAVGLLGAIWASTSGKIALITGGASVILGGAHLASIALGSIMLGMWGGTESPEGAQIPLGQKLYDVIQRMPTGPERDAAWIKFDDYMKVSKTLAEEADPSKLKNQVQPWKQLERKWKQTMMGINVLIDSSKIERGLKTWEEIKQEEKEEEIMIAAGEKAYYARITKEKRKATLADQAFWANLQKEKQESWEMYWEEREKAEQNNMKSNLKFGLL